ncbi:MAG: hypothetical protein GY756_21405 [bacterium]|nr:hypothetical protein [bacterium]
MSVLDDLTNNLKPSVLRSICTSDTDGNRYLLAATKLTEEEYQNFIKIQQQEGQSEKLLIQAKKYMFRELADKIFCALCGHEADYDCICHKIHPVSAFSYFYGFITEGFLSLDKFADFVNQLEKEAEKKHHKNIKNEILNVESENCHLCGYYYTNCICKDFKEPGYFNTVYKLIKENKIPDQLFHDQVGVLQDE